ncbi:hypothetical protein HJB63_01280 [Rhizobium lentis]|uniref:Uncharacterized protein n=1 Tax=Rhizobium lentis TaxID=1138194 RepID=A0A9Q3M674_9HYPH|nr:hypothetical protein [Rhizobium lentis]
MANNHPLSDEEVYDLLHQALLLLSKKTVRTQGAHSVLSAAVANLEVLQKALIIMSEGRQPLRTDHEP